MKFLRIDDGLYREWEVMLGREIEQVSDLYRNERRCKERDADSTGSAAG